MVVYKQKNFSALSPDELYNILQLRSEVFVVEQDCVYQDIDGVDKTAIHCWLEEGGNLLAYLRVYWKNPSLGIGQIGRVVSRERGKGYGAQLILCAKDILSKTMQAKEAYIEAQTYAIGFYEKSGFHVASKEFYEDGIPHVEMRCPL